MAISPQLTRTRKIILFNGLHLISILYSVRLFASVARSCIVDKMGAGGGEREITE